MMIGVLNYFQTVDEEVTYLDVDEEEDEAVSPAREVVVDVVD
jgi:hypothetical protein